MLRPKWHAAAGGKAIVNDSISLDLARLENVKPKDDGSIIAACPACRSSGSDKSGNHLKIEPSGKFGCAIHPGDTKHRQAIFQRAGIKTAQKPASRIVAIYDYTDADREVAYQAIRYQPKDFRQRRPDGKGGWIWNMAGVQKVLFRLPEILRAIDAGKFVFLCEGEKDVLEMVKRGFDSTCNVGGAGKWLDRYTETLRGSDVIIIADKDKAGREHAQLVASKLHGRAKSVRVIELPDTSGKPVKDAADFFAAGGTAENLIALLDAAPQWTPQAAPSSSHADVASEYLGAQAEAEQPSAVTLLEKLNARQYSQEKPPDEPTPRFYLGGVGVSTGGNITAISSPVKTGKSAAIGAMIASTAAAPESDCLNWKSENQASLAVVHLDTEQAPFDSWQLIDRARRRVGLQTAPAWWRSFCVTGFSVREIRESIRLALDQSAQQFGGVHSLILDGVADCVADVNDPAESNDFVAELHALAIQYLCPVVGVIHLNPGSEKTRGHLGSQLERKAETNLRLEMDGNGITSIWSDKNRRAPIPKKTAPKFAWSDEHKMHVSTSGSDAIETENTVEQVHEAYRLADKTALHWSDLIAALQRVPGIKSQSTAERVYRKAKGLGIIKTNILKQWEMA